MPHYDVSVQTAAQITAEAILKIMLVTSVEEANYMIGASKPDDPTKPDDLKGESYWTAPLLMNILQRGRDVSLSLIFDALALLQESEMVIRHVTPFQPAGYDLLEPGIREAERLISTSA
jgi:hypothetical protein